MKIAIISSFDQSLINFRMDLIKDLILKKHEVHVVAPNFSEINKKIIENLEVTATSINFKRTNINPLFEMITILKFYFFFKKNRFDSVILYTAKPVIFGSIAAKLANIKNINSLITGLGHYFISSKLKSLIIKKILIILYKIALNNQKVIFQNKDDQQFFYHLGVIRDNSFVVNGSGVDTDYFEKLPSPKHISFLMISRLLKEKGVIEYIQACKYLANKYKNIKFYLGGWIDNHPNSIDDQVIKDLKNIENFYFLGKVNDVKKTFINSSIVVLPSYREGLPKIILEAMSSGRAILTTNVPGCRETVVEGKNGYLVEHQNIQSLISGMEKYIKNPQIINDMGNYSRILAIEKFDVQIVNKKMIDIINKHV